jgi:DNA repair protein RecN (Recombination protein N)
MLQSLTIRDFVIVDTLELDFQAGFTALTGETGAGKSILIDALSLALGARSEGSGVVRMNAAKADITALFDISSRKVVRTWLAQNELQNDADEATCVVRRVIDKTGRSKSFINGVAVPLSQLKELGENLLDIHGQFEHHRLFSRQAQRGLLDDFAGNQTKLVDTAEHFATWKQLQAQRLQFEQDQAAIVREREDLQDHVRELGALKFTLLGWQNLQDEQRRLANAASLIEAAEAGLETLTASDSAVLGQLETLSVQLKRESQADAALADAAEMVESATVQIKEASHALRNYLRHLEPDPARLAQADRQIAAIQDCARKYRIEPSAIADVFAKKTARLSLLNTTQSIEQIQAQEQAAEQQYLLAAQELSKRRKTAATKFAKAISQSMQELAMPGGRLEVALVASPPSAEGLEAVEFSVAAHEGQAVGLLGKVASGGELSRISLAIQMIASAKAGVPTLIFDEVDSGIGGRVADVVGRLLAQLGRKFQVLTVTHLPQVAAYANQQLLVAKSLNAQKVVTSHITVLDAAARVEEIARMLGGASITKATRSHAQEMLTQAVSQAVTIP